MLIRKDTGRISRRKRIVYTMRAIYVLVVLVLIFNSDDWPSLVIAISYPLILMLESPEGIVPHIELRDDLVIVNEDQIKIGDIDLSISRMTEKKLRLCNTTQWKNTLEADLTFLRKDDVEALRHAVWGRA